MTEKQMEMNEQMQKLTHVIEAIEDARTQAENAKRQLLQAQQEKEDLLRQLRETNELLEAQA